MNLPVFISNPHAGWRIPPEVAGLCRLTRQEISDDGDAGAREIFDLADEVAGFCTTEIARAFVDLNRAPEDRSRDGVVKSHTCWNVPIYSRPLPESVVRSLIQKYYDPFHAVLSAVGKRPSIRLAIDAHTMASIGPPIAPDPACRRPRICLSDHDGTTLPPGWMDCLLTCFQAVFGSDVAVNRPFAGGYITRRYGREFPWIQLEISREAFWPDAEKRHGVVEALKEFFHVSP